MTGNDKSSGTVLHRPSASVAASRSVPFHLGYRPSLDGLRGIAVLAVMAYHFSPSRIRGGFLGVDLFFVLSGFLITCLLVEEWHKSGGINLRSFYVRRGLRLLPALFVLLAVCGPFVGGIWVLLAVFYVTNWGLATGFVQIGPLSHLWLLAVEEQFYLVWPLVLWFLLSRRVPRSAVVAITCALALASALLKIAWWSGASSWLRLYHGSDARADALLAGCLVGLLVSWGMLPPARWMKPVGALLALAGALYLVDVGSTAHLPDAFLYRQGGLTMAALSGAVVVLHLVTNPFWPLRWVLEWPALVAVGRISYALYLWHHPILWLTLNWGWSELPLLAVRVGLSLAAALISYVVVERPALRLKTRFASRDRSAFSRDNQSGLVGARS